MLVKPELLTAAAALAAIIIYFLTTRRENQRWRRDALLEAMVGFLDGSFSRYSERAFNASLAAGADPAISEKMETYRGRAADGTRRQNSSLTRIRLLAPAPIIHEAEKVIEEDQRIQQWFDDPSQGDSTWSALNGPRQPQRLELINAYRKKFGLGDTRHLG